MCVPRKEHTINTFLNSTWSKKKSKEKFLNILNRQNENTTHKNLGSAAAAMLRDKFTELSAYVSREISKFNNLSFYLRKLER